MPVFETERLILQPASLSDASLLLELFNSPKWLQYIGDRNVRTLQDAEVYITNRMLPQIERLGYGTFVLIRKEDGNRIGICGLFDREGLEGIDIGFALLPQYEGRGYAFEGVNRIKEAAFTVFHLAEIVAITTEENKASQCLLQKLGLSFERYIQLPGDLEELMLYRLQFPQ